MRDLTQRYAVEAEREDFKRRVAESEKMLAIGRVASGVAHELNNPLAVVLSESEMLTMSASSDDARTGLQLITEQAHRARHIVKDLSPSCGRTRIGANRSTWCNSRAA